MIHPSDWLEFIWLKLSICYKQANLYLYQNPIKVLIFVLALHGVSSLSFWIWLQTMPENSTPMRIVPFAVVNLVYFRVVYYHLKKFRTYFMTPEELEKEYDRLSKELEEKKRRI